MDNGENIAGKYDHVIREIASLTKIMTCHIVISFIKQYNLDPKEIKFEVSDKAS